MRQLATPGKLTAHPASIVFRATATLIFFTILVRHIPAFFCRILDLRSKFPDLFVCPVFGHILLSRF
jgi:hypothetical protein